VVRAAGALLFTVLAAWGTLALLGILGPDWTRYLPASCLATHCFCEAPHAGLVLQPANSWSSLGFVFAGAWIMLHGPSASREAPFSGWTALWFGVTSIVIGVGSFLLHATLTLWGQFNDVLGMYLLGGFILSYALQRWRRLSAGAAIALYLVTCAILIGSLWIMPETRRWFFAVALLAAIAVEFMFARPLRAGIQVKWFVYGLIANIVAFGIWILDNTRTLCAPQSWLQGHAVWHLLGAAAVYFTYRYYRSEQGLPARAPGGQTD
jgi:hypothetical protein